MIRFVSTVEGATGTAKVQTLPQTMFCVSILIIVFLI